MLNHGEPSWVRISIGKLQSPNCDQKTFSKMKSLAWGNIVDTLIFGQTTDISVLASEINKVLTIQENLFTVT